MPENKKDLLNKDVDEPEADKAIAKIVILAILGIAFSFLFGYFLRLFIFEGQLNFLLFSFLAALGFLVFFLLNVFYVKNLWLVNLIILGEFLALAAQFYDQFSRNFGVGVLFSLSILLLANYAGRQELDNVLKIKFWTISKKTVPKAITALALFVSVLYLGLINAEIKTKGFFISAASFEKFISPISKIKIIQRFVPSFDPSLPIEKLIENLVADQIKQQNSEFELLPASVKTELINQNVRELEKEISDFVGFSLNPKDKASDVLYKMMIEKFGGLPANVKENTPLIVAALIFLTILGLSLPIRLIVSVSAFLIYEICLALGFSTIMMEGKSREIIILR